MTQLLVTRSKILPLVLSASVVAGCYSQPGVADGSGTETDADADTGATAGRASTDGPIGTGGTADEETSTATEDGCAGAVFDASTFNTACFG